MTRDELKAREDAAFQRGVARARHVQAPAFSGEPIPGSDDRKIGNQPIECARYSADAEPQDDGLVKVTLWRTTDPGPMLEYKPAAEFLLDHPHALELTGSLSIALSKINPRPQADLA